MSILKTTLQNKEIIIVYYQSTKKKYPYYRKNEVLFKMQKLSRTLSLTEQNLQIIVYIVFILTIFVLIIF